MNFLMDKKQKAKPMNAGTKLIELYNIQNLQNEISRFQCIQQACIKKEFHLCRSVLVFLLPKH